jgi:hypothetical protein
MVCGETALGMYSLSTHNKSKILSRKKHSIKGTLVYIVSPTTLAYVYDNRIRC